MNINEVEINLDPIRGQVCNISRMLPVGSKYYTLHPSDCDKQFEKKKAALLANPASPDFLPNRSPRVIMVRDHSVITQTFKTDIDGTQRVVFNPETEDEAQATIIAGDINFGQTTDEAVKDALQGQSRIFASGIKTATKANALNQAELERVIEQIKYWTSMKDNLTSAIASNTKKVKEYEEALAKFKQPVDMSSNGSVHVVVTE